MTRTTALKHYNAAKLAAENHGLTAKRAALLLASKAEDSAISAMNACCDAKAQSLVGAAEALRRSIVANVDFLEADFGSPVATRKPVFDGGESVALRISLGLAV